MWWSLSDCCCVDIDEFNVYTREAGAGDVSVSIEGPSKAKIEMIDRQCGYVTVGYVVSQPGNQLFCITYSGPYGDVNTKMPYTVQCTCTGNANYLLCWLAWWWNG